MASSPQLAGRCSAFHVAKQATLRAQKHVSSCTLHDRKFNNRPSRATLRMRGPLGNVVHLQLVEKEWILSVGNTLRLPSRPYQATKWRGYVFIYIDLSIAGQHKAVRHVSEQDWLPSRT